MYNVFVIYKYCTVLVILEFLLFLFNFFWCCCCQNEQKIKIFIVIGWTEDEWSEAKQNETKQTERAKVQKEWAKWMGKVNFSHCPNCNHCYCPSRCNHQTDVCTPISLRTLAIVITTSCFGYNIAIDGNIRSSWYAMILLRLLSTSA